MVFREMRDIYCKSRTNINKMHGTMQTDLMSKQVVHIITTGLRILMIRIHRLYAPHSSSSGSFFSAFCLSLPRFQYSFLYTFRRQLFLIVWISGKRVSSQEKRTKLHQHQNKLKHNSRPILIFPSPFRVNISL